MPCPAAAHSGMSENMTDRKSKRVSSAILIDIFETTSAVPKGRGCIVDLSIGGLALESEASLPIGDELFLRIYVHDSNDAAPVEFYAQVMRFQEFGNIYHYGLKFTRLGFFDKFKLRKNINRLIAGAKKTEINRG